MRKAGVSTLERIVKAIPIALSFEQAHFPTTAHRGDTAGEKLNGLALRIVLIDHVGISHDNQPDLLTKAEALFAPKKPKAEKDAQTKKAKPTGIKAVPKKTAPRQKAA